MDFNVESIEEKGIATFIGFESHFSKAIQSRFGYGVDILLPRVIILISFDGGGMVSVLAKYSTFKSHMLGLSKLSPFHSTSSPLGQTKTTRPYLNDFLRSQRCLGRTTRELHHHCCFEQCEETPAETLSYEWFVHHRCWAKNK